MLFGAFGNASLAMQTMDHAMGTISQNIANINTTGYKRKDTEFKTVMSESHSSPGTTQNSPTASTATTGLDIFGVRAVDRYMITQQGTIASTNNWTDLGINGRGFFVVTAPDTSGQPQATLSESDARGTLYTREGNFVQQAIGTKSYFTTAGGQFLMGWMADAQGNIPGVATTASSPVTSSSGTTSSASTGKPSMTPIYTLPGQTIPGVATTAIQTVMNLPADAAMTASPQSFVNTSIITDGTGAAQDLTMTWTRVDGDNWTVDFSLPTGPASGSVGTITSPSTTVGATTLPRMNVTMDRFGNITSPSTSASGTGFADLSIAWSAGATPTTTAAVDLNTQKPSLHEVPITLTVYDNAFNPENLMVGFERTSSGQWYMRIKNPTANGSVTALSETGGTTTTTTTTTSSTIPGSVPITFDGSGKIITPSTINLGFAWTPSVAATTPATVAVPTVLQPYTSALQAAAQGVTAPGMPATAAQLTTYQTSLDTAIGAVAIAAPATAADLTAYSASIYTAFATANTTTATAASTAASKAGTNTIALDVSKLTQYVGSKATAIDIKSNDQDGYASGVMDGTEFIKTGELIGHFSNGRTRTLAMVPVATFVAADNLDAISGTLFRRTQQAGDMTIDSIGAQGSGAQIVASAVETSNVDLADEFTRMIITQKAYSMNATVFKTADEMSTTARDLMK
ncbi:flagellar hook-basal body complex protein [Paramagnetospirillum kuznetsovii]|uniref:flagellar hook-basal body complex protein n=1 Tax=Paramagnetospirillum kuznetsovii TaxID=2053833 RepID=UPI00137506B9|nr:flagellar hook-basal body complex protein [Paramagnetospirillum kuznetsovii]